MSLRIIVRTDDGQHLAHGAGPVVTTFKTFVIEAPEIEQYLNFGGHNEDGSYQVRSIVGIEEIARPDSTGEAGK